VLFLAIECAVSRRDFDVAEFLSATILLPALTGYDVHGFARVFHAFFAAPLVLKSPNPRL
jgi:hypothetical protein